MKKTKALYILLKKISSNAVRPTITIFIEPKKKTKKKLSNKHFSVFHVIKEVVILIEIKTIKTGGVIMYRLQLHGERTTSLITLRNFDSPVSNWSKMTLNILIFASLSTLEDFCFPF